MSHSIFLGMTNEIEFGIAIIVAGTGIGYSTWESIVAGRNDFTIWSDYDATNFGAGILRPTRNVIRQTNKSQVPSVG
jgi:hypothetical protein